VMKGRRKLQPKKKMSADSFQVIENPALYKQWNGVHDGGRHPP